MKQLETILMEFYEDMFELSEDSEYPTEQARIIAQAQLLKEYKDRIQEL